MNEAKADVLQGPRFVVDIKSSEYPRYLQEHPQAPKKLFCIGNIEACSVGLAVVGARKATPYGTSCAKRFSKLAAAQGISIISGGALGCDSAAHSAALEAKGTTVAVLGGGCDCVYPKRNFKLFQDIIDAGGAVVSEWGWDVPPMPAFFRLRNRIIAGMAKATLVVEAGLPSGTFVTADETLEIGREVLVVPGSISAPNSKGTNRLLYQGAIPIVDDESFLEILTTIFTRSELQETPRVYINQMNSEEQALLEDPLISALLAEPLSQEEIFTLAKTLCGHETPSAWSAVRIETAQNLGLITRYPDGKYGVYC